MNYLYVFFGCGLGGIARHALTKLANERILTAVPAGTLAVNLIGCLLIGFAVSLVNDTLVPTSLRLLAITGFLGGFTTFSTYALETAVLFQNHAWKAGMVSLFAHNGLGLAAVSAGMFLYALAKGTPPAPR